MVYHIFGEISTFTNLPLLNNETITDKLYLI
jgi:hypothetical protein